MHTADELIGRFVNGYFVNGIIPDAVLRFQAFHIDKKKLEDAITTAGLRFLHLDGPVSRELGEFLNPMLDDSHTLELPSGDRVYVNNFVRVIFEVDTLS